MCKYSNLQVLLLLPVMGNVLVESSLVGTSSVTDILSIIGPKTDILPKSTLPACPGCEESLNSKEFLNAVQNSKLGSGSNREKSVAPCEVLKFLGEMSTCAKCDLDFVVLILANRNGKKVIVGQGLRMSDGSILTIYVNIQTGTDFEVLFLCGAKKKVKCIKSPKKCPKNVLSEYIYLVLLELEDSYIRCCTEEAEELNQDCDTELTQDYCTMDDCFAEPRFEKCTDYSPISGCLMVSTNDSSTDHFRLTCLPAYYVNDPTGLAASQAFPEDPSKLTAGTLGGVFLTEDCKILGMISIKPIVAVGALNLLPLANQVATACETLIIPIECFYE